MGEEAPQQEQMSRDQIENQLREAMETGERVRVTAVNDSTPFEEEGIVTEVDYEGRLFVLDGAKFEMDAVSKIEKIKAPKGGEEGGEGG